MLGTLHQNEIEQLLHESFVGRIGCHADGVTYVVPISYAYDSSFIYGYGPDGKKNAMMRKNPSVCFEVDDTKDPANWKSVIASGVYDELDGGEVRTQALHLLNSRILPINSSVTMHLGSEWPFSGDDLSALPGIVFRIRLIEKTGRFEKSDASSAFA